MTTSESRTVTAHGIFNKNSMEHTKAYQEFKKNGNTKFVRYSEGAEMYHMSVSKFMQMAKDAKAIYKLGQLVLVNLKIFDEYIETFHIVDDEFYK